MTSDMFFGFIFDGVLWIFDFVVFVLRGGVTMGGPVKERHPVHLFVVVEVRMVDYDVVVAG